MGLNRLEHLGFGTQLYLRESQMLCGLFFVMACIQTPALAFNYLSQEKMQARAAAASPPAGLAPAR